MITDAVKALALGTASIGLNVTRTTLTGSAAACVTISHSTLAATTGVAAVSCDSSDAYLGSNGLTTYTMMNGITASNLQVPIAQNFNGANA